MKIIIVNDHDEVIGVKERDARTAQDISRITALYIFNSQNEVLLARRAFDKRYEPGTWGVSVAGTLEEGETYDSNIIKEAAEELGIILNKNNLIFGKHGYISASHKYFYQIYFAKQDIDLKDFKIQTEEVAGVRWSSVAALSDEIKNQPENFTHSFIDNFEYLLDFLNSH